MISDDQVRAEIAYLDPDNEKQERAVNWLCLFMGIGDGLRCKPGCVTQGAHRVPIDCYVPEEK